MYIESYRADFMIWLKVGQATLGFCTQTNC